MDWHSHEHIHWHLHLFPSISHWHLHKICACSWIEQMFDFHRLRKKSSIISMIPWYYDWNIWLVVTWTWLDFDFPYLGNFIIPFDELISFRGVGQPPARWLWMMMIIDDYWWLLMITDIIWTFIFQHMVINHTITLWLFKNSHGKWPIYRWFPY